MIQHSCWHVTAMTAADMPEVVAIECQGRSPWNSTQLASELRHDNATQLVCKSSAGGRIAGFIMARTVLDEADILKIATSQELQRQGVASLLLQSFIALTEQQGATRIHLELRANNLAALALYYKLGFEVKMRRPGYYNDPREDALCMTLAI